MTTGEFGKRINTTETTSNQEVEYPLGYFDAQVRFALKWSEISEEPLAQVLQYKTALYRRVTNAKTPKGNEIWQKILQEIQSIREADAISAQFYANYLQQPHHLYTPPSHPENDGKHFGYFAFDNYPANPETGEKDRIKVHFINQNRGDRSGLDPIYLQQRRADLKRMFTYIRANYPRAEEVIGGSWLYALQSYRDSFPPSFTANMKRLVPKGFGHLPNSVPNMSFEGNSVWGQFVDRRGGVRQHIYDKFLQNVEKAKSLEDLVNAFPNVPYQPRVPIDVFFEWLDQ
jgi:hypothetical protein